MKYALIQNNTQHDTRGSGMWVGESTAFGVGNTPELATADAEKWLDGERPDGLVMVQITEASAAAILAGQPDAVEICA